MRLFRVALFSGLLLVAIFFAWTQRSPTIETLESENPIGNTFNAPSPLTPSLENLSLNVLTEAPEGTEEDLAVQASKLSGTEIKALSSKSTDSTLNGDERALSVYLLALNQSIAVVPELTSIALTPWSNQLNPRQQEEEQVIRALAIEGLERSPTSLARVSLQKIVNQSASPFLVDRAHRAILSRDGAVSSLEDQDNQALSELLKKTN